VRSDRARARSPFTDGSFLPEGSRSRGKLRFTRRGACELRQPVSATIAPWRSVRSHRRDRAGYASRYKFIGSEVSVGAGAGALAARLVSLNERTLPEARQTSPTCRITHHGHRGFSLGGE